MDRPALLSVPEAAAELQASEAYVRRMLIRQQLYGVKVGPVWIIARDDLESFKRMRRSPGRPQKAQAQPAEELETRRRITAERAATRMNRHLRRPQRGS